MVQLIAEALSQKKVSTELELRLKMRTANDRREYLIKKIGCRGIADITHHALQHRIITLESREA